MNEIDDKEMDESMDSFEAALSARHVELPNVQLRRICLAFDGTNQDAPAKELATAVAAHVSAEIHQVRDGEGPHFRRILDECRAADAELIIVPAPFGDDFAELGAASIGTNLDMLLAKRGTPLLVVRDPERDAAASLREVVVPLTFDVNDDARAAAWAFKLVAPNGRLRLLAVADTEVLAQTNPMVADALDIKDLDEAAFAGLGQPQMGGLIAAVQRRAAAERIGCRVSVRLGSWVEKAIAMAAEIDCLLVASCPGHDCSPGYARIHALVRQSRDPVLVL